MSGAGGIPVVHGREEVKTSVPQLTIRREERPPFELVHEPDGRSWTARENLSDILERELLGPANGPDELLNRSKCSSTPVSTR